MKSNELTVLIVDESAHEAAVITSAIRLHNARLEVRTVADAQTALHYLHDGGDQLVILGARAIADAPGLITRLNGDGARHVMVGIAPQIAPTVRERAIAAGVRDVHQRPNGWADYRDLVKEILDRWMK